MFKTWINKLKEVLTYNSITINEKGIINVKDITHSTVNINSLDVDDLKNIRKMVSEDYYHLIDELTVELTELLKPNVNSLIKHLYTIEHIKNASQDNKILFENNLVFFTQREIDNHLMLIEHLKTRKTALLCGYPATGKSIAVVDIAERLKQQGYNTYYHSFKKTNRWGEIWEEIIQNKGDDIVFVIDDIHLEPEHTAEALLKINDFDDLNILFISREVTSANDTDQLDIYEELNNFTIRTEQPNIDDKAKGMIDKFQNYYQNKNGGLYKIGNYESIIKKSYRNLIVLREYLKYWESLPDISLGDLYEDKFYKNIYSRYFADIKDSWKPVFLQYLALYYFEINFFPSPKYLAETDALADNSNRIMKNSDDSYSIYHGEYAFLILKAYKSVNSSKFNRKYKRWEDFFIDQICAYLQGFVDHDEYPNNFLDVFNGIFNATKVIEGGVRDSRLIFKSIIDNEVIRHWLLNVCNEESTKNEILSLMPKVITHTPFIKPFLIAFQDNKFLYNNYLSFYLYTSSYSFLMRYQPENLDWLECYFKPYMETLNLHSSVVAISTGLSRLYKIDKQKSISLYLSIEHDVLVEKLKSSKIKEIGLVLSELKNLDLNKTRALYEDISIEVLQGALKNFTIKEIGHALNELANVNRVKTSALYEGISTEDLQDSLKNSEINEIGHALNELKNVDLTKTRELYVGISIENLHGALKNSKINDIGRALNELKNVDRDKTNALYLGISINDLQGALKNSKINDIGQALNELKNVDRDKTNALYLGLSINDLQGALKNSKINEIGHALNELKNVDLVKTKELFDDIPIEDLQSAIKTSKINEIGHALNGLKNIDLDKTRALYAGISVEDLHNTLQACQINKIGHALSQLKDVDLPKTKALYVAIPIENLLTPLTQSQLNEISHVLNQLKDVDLNRTRELYQSLSFEYLIDVLKVSDINIIGIALSKLKEVDLDRTRELYNHVGNLFIKKKILEKALTYKTLIIILSTFPKLSPTLSKELLSQLPNRTLFNKKELRADTFNILLSTLINAGYAVSDDIVKELLVFGMQKRRLFIYNNKLQTIGSYINLMESHSSGLGVITDNEFTHLKRLIKSVRQKEQVSAFIPVLYQHFPAEAIKLFDFYKKIYPKEEQTIAYTNYNVGKNLVGNGRMKEAFPFLTDAEIIFNTIEMNEIAGEVNNLLKELEKTSKSDKINRH